MSLERDLAHAFTVLGSRLSAVEECLVQLSRDSAQQSDWRHQQRNLEQARIGRERDQALAMKQVHIFMGDFSRKLSELAEALETARVIRHDDVKRIRALERRPTPMPDEEETQP